MDINVLAFLVPAGIIVSNKFIRQVCFMLYVLITSLTWCVSVGRHASRPCLMQAPLWSFILWHQFIFLESWWDNVGSWCLFVFLLSIFIFLCPSLLFWLILQVRLMLVFAPAACIMSGIALSASFDVFTRSIKFQLPGVKGNSQVDVSLFLYAILPIYIHLSSINLIRTKIHFCFWPLRQGKLVLKVL